MRITTEVIERARCLIMGHLRGIAILLCHRAVIPRVRINKDTGRSEFLCSLDLQSNKQV